MPIFEKEMVYNEWGAVIKHQDEVQKSLIKSWEQDALRNRQIKYKAELDLQMQQ